MRREQLVTDLPIIGWGEIENQLRGGTATGFLDHERSKEMNLARLPQQALFS